MIALSQAPVGKTQEVKWIMGGIQEKDTLDSIGIREGSKLTVVSSFLGSVIVAIDNMRYALSKELAFQVKMG